jgi:large subunit ribosomal protein L24e
MTKCVFCGKEDSPYKGVHLITNDGNMNFYCSGKCRKNALKLGRDKKKLKWTEAYRISKEKAAISEAKAVEKAKATGERKEAESRKEAAKEKKK